MVREGGMRGWGRGRETGRREDEADGTAYRLGRATGIAVRIVKVIV